MSESLSDLDTLRRIDAACDQFELEWRSGRDPRMEDYLKLFPAEERVPLLTSLTSLHQELVLRKLATADADTPCSSPRKPPAPTMQEKVISVPDPDATVVPGVTVNVISGPHTGQTFYYSEHDTLLVGRSKHAQLKLSDDPRVSRHHFRLEIKPPECYLMDLNSSNGTHVNGERVSDRFLKNGDTISVGRTKLAVLMPLGTQDRTPVKSPVAPAPTVTPQQVAVRPQLVTPVPAPSSGLPGWPQIVGYQLQSQLGVGEIGTVYRAIRTATGETCALKVISTEAQQDEKSTQTFLREASVLTQLIHPHIVRLVETGRSGRELFLSTEFVEALPWSSLCAGWTVAKRIRVACGLMVQILSALECAHEKSMVHRDVKPENLLISKSDGKLVAKLADFGLAKQFTNSGLSRITRNGDVIGSLPYMAPEQFINSRDARPGCDLYSAGATLYWMLTGEDPISLENHPCKFLAILEDAPVPLEKRRPEASKKLCEVVHRALEKDPARRFSSAKEMRMSLRKCVEPA